MKMFIYYNMLLINMLLCHVVTGSLYALKGCQKNQTSEHRPLSRYRKPFMVFQQHHSRLTN